MTIGKVRPAVANMAGYKPGKAADQLEVEHDIDDAIKLASNENPWPPIAEVVEAVAEAAAGINRYPDNGAAAVRDAVGDFLNVDSSHITIGCGSSGLLQQLFLTYVDPGDEVLFPYPSFEIYPIFSTLFGAEQVRVPLVDHGFDLDAVADAVTDRTKLIMLANPNNPTGTSVSVDSIAQLLQSIADDVIVVVDEAYREFNDPTLGDPVTLLADHHNVVITRSFSKAFGLAGVRAGYAIAHAGIIEQLDKVRLAFSVNNIAQAAILASIEHRDAVMERVRDLMNERDRVVGSLRAGGVELPDPNANFVFIPTGEDTASIGEQMERQGIAVRPFPGIGLRITIGTPEENDRWVHAFLKIVSARTK